MTTARGHMWMGPRGYETWVPGCAISPDFSRSGFTAVTGFANGGVGVVNSKAAARHYQMTWGPRPQGDMRVISDMAAGLFDTQLGINLIYFLDPMSYLTNAAPEYLGNPATAGEGAPSLFGWDNTPSLVATGANQYRYPARTAVWRADRASMKTYIPIPPGFTAWVGAHGTATGAAGIRVTQALGTQDGSSTMLTMMDTVSPNLVNYSLAAGNGVTGLTIDSPATGLLRNLAPNPSFESDVVGTGSIAGTGGVAAVTRVAAASSSFGSWAARSTWSQATSAASPGGLYETIPLTAGQLYSFGISVRASKALTMQLAVTWLNAGGSVIGSPVLGSTISVPAAGSWATAPEAQMVGVIAPSGAVSAQVAVQSTATSFAIADWIEMDAIHVNSTSQVVTYSWTGTTNASTSTQAINGNVTRTNLALDPAATRAANYSIAGNTGWGPQWYGASPGAGTTTYLTGQVDAPQGTTTYTRKTWTTAPASAGDVGFIHSPGATTVTNALGVPVVAGQSLSVSANLRNKTQANLQYSIQLFWHDASGNYISTTAGTTVVMSANGNVWTQASVTAVAPALAASVGIKSLINFVSGTLPQPGDILDGGALLIENSSTLKTYFDGNTPDLGLNPYTDGNSLGWQWTGAVNDSVSAEVADVLSLTGVVVQILPTGAAPTPGNYISGQGNGGCQFSPRPTETPYNAVIGDGSGGIGLMGMSATLIESGPWL